MYGYTSGGAGGQEGEDAEMDRVRARQQQRVAAREEETRDAEAASAAAAAAERMAREEHAGSADAGADGGRAEVSSMRGELETMRAEHARLLARRDAEIESVAAVEARCVVCGVWWCVCARACVFMCLCVCSDMSCGAGAGCLQCARSSSG
jgi:hypothetical protein